MRHWPSVGLIATICGLLLVLALSGRSDSREPTLARVFDPSIFKPVEELLERTPSPGWWEPEAAGQWLARELNKPRATPAPPTPRPTPRSTPRPPAAPQTSHSIAGKASWYCKAGVSICHYRYPPGSMVAAACGKLRAAMGPGWRGRLVVVRASSGRQVTVKLVDWCGSKTKLIDLYWEPMRRLGGTGVLSVKVRW